MLGLFHVDHQRREVNDARRIRLRKFHASPKSPFRHGSRLLIALEFARV
jgi:hypothetical protein